MHFESLYIWLASGECRRSSNIILVQYYIRVAHYKILN